MDMDILWTTYKNYKSSSKVVLFWRLQLFCHAKLTSWSPAYEAAKGRKIVQLKCVGEQEDLRQNDSYHDQSIFFRQWPRKSNQNNSKQYTPENLPGTQHLMSCNYTFFLFQGGLSHVPCLIFGRSTPRPHEHIKFHPFLRFHPPASLLPCACAFCRRSGREKSKPILGQKPRTTSFEPAWGGRMYERGAYLTPKLKILPQLHGTQLTPKSKILPQFSKPIGTPMSSIFLLK